MKVYVVVRGDKQIQSNLGVYGSLYDALIEAATVPTPVLGKPWKRDIDDSGTIVWTCNDDWIRVEEMELGKKVQEAV
jgi:hypothetical protein